MKINPVPTAGIAVAAVAAISATAVVLKKKGKKIVEPLASFTAKEWEELKDWPAVKAVLNDSKEPDDAEEVKEESVVAPTVEVQEKAVKNTEKTVAPAEQIVIGEEPGQVKAFSAEYRKIINKVFKEASNDETVTLELFGKTYGLGAKGQKIEDTALPGTLYNAADIAKLHKKLESK